MWVPWRPAYRASPNKKEVFSVLRRVLRGLKRCSPRPSASSADKKVFPVTVPIQKSRNPSPRCPKNRNLLPYDQAGQGTGFPGASR